METATVAVIVAALALLFNVAVTLFGGGWRFSGRITTIEGQISAIESKLHAATNIEERQAVLARQFGETLTALRQKINDVELHAANNYVRRESFYKAVDELKADLRAAFEKIDKTFDRLESKIEHAGDS